MTCAKCAELEARLNALEWRQITESNLPTSNDETYSTKHGCVTGPAFSERSFEWWTKEREWTHFRPILTKEQAIELWNTRSDAHLLRSHEALREALKGYRESKLHSRCQPAEIFEGEQLYDTRCKLCELADAALTEAAAQKENGNG